MLQAGDDGLCTLCWLLYTYMYMYGYCILIYYNFFHIGADLDSLPLYGKRTNRTHVNNRKLSALVLKYCFVYYALYSYRYLTSISACELIFP